EKLQQALDETVKSLPEGSDRQSLADAASKAPGIGPGPSKARTGREEEEVVARRPAADEDASPEG
ncbi:MAG TPA: hypothetical protein VE173_11445, partial [Longimicrobiales bacterium]|nr:hypothetical protein [Longimicrobiales bacterium]